MENKTYIIGKDASLEKSIARMQKQLESLGFHIVEHSWLNPLPHVWSVHIRDRDCPLFFTNGKGASKKAALASALGEFFERLATNYFWADYYLGDEMSEHAFVHYKNEKWFSIEANEVRQNQWPEGLLSAELLAFYDPDKTLTMLDLVDINSAHSKRGVCALPYICQRNQQTVWFPVNIIGNLYVSNGMSAGNTPSEARVQALSEIFERHVKFKILEEGMTLPDVPPSILDQYPSIKEGIAKLEQEGFGVLIKDASLGGQYPVICVVLLNPENQGCFASFGAHPKFEVALERSLTELVQGRELNSLNEFPAPIFDLDEVASQENLETHFIDSSGLVSWEFLKNDADYEFSQCDFEGSTDEEFLWLCELIHQSGRDIYISDYDHLGVYACRILVPSMSEIYPSEDLLWANNNNGISIRKEILRLAELSSEEAATLLETIQHKDIDDLQPVAALIGIPVQADTIWKDFRVAELNVMLAAISGQIEKVREGCEWITSFGQLETTRMQGYSYILTVLQSENPDDYKRALQKMFPEKVIQQAEALMSGKLEGYNFENSLHQGLISGYEKIHLAKERA
ncbi:MAG: 30S ribosomal protein S12 methylthiotransferase accessory factor YcaO [Thiotrichaceae bacterium]